MSKIIKNFLNDEEGATAIEYGLIAGLISVAIAVTVKTLGTDLNTIFLNISKAIKGTP